MKSMIILKKIFSNIFKCCGNPDENVIINHYYKDKDKPALSIYINEPWLPYILDTSDDPLLYDINIFSFDLSNEYLGINEDTLVSDIIKLPFTINKKNYVEFHNSLVKEGICNPLNGIKYLLSIHVTEAPDGNGVEVKCVAVGTIYTLAGVIKELNNHERDYLVIGEVIRRMLSCSNN